VGGHPTFISSIHRRNSLVTAVIDAMVEVKVEVGVTEDVVMSGETKNRAHHQLRTPRRNRQSELKGHHGDTARRSCTRLAHLCGLMKGSWLEATLRVSQAKVRSVGSSIQRLGATSKLVRMCMK